MKLFTLFALVTSAVAAKLNENANDVNADVECSSAFEMCGGKLFPDSPNCCVEGYFCSDQFEDYHQCLPLAYQTKTTTTESTTTTTTTTKPTTTTTTTEPTTTTVKVEPSVTGTRYDIIKTGEYEIVDGWENWSWGVKTHKFDNEGNYQSIFTVDQWGGVSFINEDVVLTSGKLHFKAKANVKGASLNVIAHTLKDDAIVITTIENISNTKMTDYEVEVKVGDKVQLNRFSFQDIGNKGFTLSLNDVYFIDGAKAPVNPAAPTTTKPEPVVSNTVKVEPSTSSTRYDIIKSGEYKIADGWDNWSWGIKTHKFDPDGNYQSVFSDGQWGGVSFINENVKLTSGKLYFKAKANVKGASLTIIAHTIDDDAIVITTIDNVASNKMTNYEVEIKMSDKVQFNRISFHDIYNGAYTLSLNDVYFVDGVVAQFVPASTTTTTTTTVKPTTTTTTTTVVKTITTTTTTKPITTTTTVKVEPSVSSNRYDIIKSGEYKIVDGWDNWSWGIKTYRFDNEGNFQSIFSAGQYGGVSFINENVKLTSGKLHFKAKANVRGASLTIFAHTVNDDAVLITTIDNIASNKMTDYEVEINLGDKVLFNRVSFHDIYNGAYTLSLNDVYFVESAVAQFVPAPTTTTTTVKVEPTVSGTRYDIMKSGQKQFLNGWMNQSWGVRNYGFNNQGNYESILEAQQWGAVSVKNLNVQLGSGILYFKAKSSNVGASLNVFIHTIDEEFIQVGTIERLTPEMKEYRVEIKIASNLKFNRITLQDATNKGFSITVTDLYYMDGAIANANGNANAYVNPGNNSASTGTRYDIIKPGTRQFVTGWMDQSWGVRNYGFNNQGNYESVIEAQQWGAVSLKNWNVQLGSGILYFKAKANIANASLYVFVHTIDEDFIQVGYINRLTTNMKDYQIEIKVNKKFNRITLQDGTNNGYTITLNDVYYVQY